MPKLTIATLKALVATELDVDRIAIDSPFVPSYETLTGLLVKIGEQYSIDSNFEDKLSYLTHRNLDFGTTVEEWFNDIRLPVPHDRNGSTNMAPKDPTFQDVAYSYQLDKYVADTTMRNADIKKGFLGREQFEALTASIMKKLYDAQSLHRYFVKKQLIGRFINAIPANGTVVNGQVINMRTVIAQPTDTASAESWAKALKDKVEAMTDLITQENNLRGVPARSPELTFYALPKLKSVIDIDLLAGAFNKEKAEIPVKIMTLEDFGDLATLVDESEDPVLNANAWGLLVDDRGLRVYPSEVESDQDRNGQGGFTNFYLKEAYTCVFSKVVNAHVFVNPTT